MNIERYRIGDLLLDTGVQEVTRNGVIIPLPPLSFDLFLTLSRRAPNLVTIGELEDEVWKNLVISPATVAKRIALLRESLGDNAEEPKYIAVVRGRGYRLIPPVSSTRKEKKVEADSGETPVQAGNTSWPWHLGLATATGIALVTLVFFLQLEKPADDGAPSPTTHDLEDQFSGQTPADNEFPERSIAVIPFINLGEHGNDILIANGITEQIINSLANVKTLQVVAHTSSFAYQNREYTIESISKTLKVNHVLEGSVQRYGENIRITAQLIDARTGYHMWSQQYDRPFTNNITLQDDIALDITSALKDNLTGAGRHD